MTQRKNDEHHPQLATDADMSALTARVMDEEDFHFLFRMQVNGRGTGTCPKCGRLVDVAFMPGTRIVMRCTNTQKCGRAGMISFVYNVISTPGRAHVPTDQLIVDEAMQRGEIARWRAGELANKIRRAARKAARKQQRTHNREGR